MAFTKLSSTRPSRVVQSVRAAAAERKHLERNHLGKAPSRPVSQVKPTGRRPNPMVLATAASSTPQAVPPTRVDPSHTRTSRIPKAPAPGSTPPRMDDNLPGSRIPRRVRASKELASQPTPRPILKASRMASSTSTPKKVHFAFDKIVVAEVRYYVPSVKIPADIKGERLNNATCHPHTPGVRKYTQSSDGRYLLIKADGQFNPPDTQGFEGTIGQCPYCSQNLLSQGYLPDYQGLDPAYNNLPEEVFDDNNRRWYDRRSVAMDAFLCEEHQEEDDSF